MPPRRSPAQIRSQLRQAQSRARSNQQKLNQAIRNYNRQVDKVNASRRKFVNDYNAAVRQYNRSVDAFNREQKRRAAAARTNRSRLEQELRRLDRATTSRTVRTEFRTSVDSLVASAARFQDGHSAAWSTTDLGDLLQGEVANSVATLSAWIHRRGCCWGVGVSAESASRTGMMTVFYVVTTSRPGGTFCESIIAQVGPDRGDLR